MRLFIFTVYDIKKFLFEIISGVQRAVTEAVKTSDEAHFLYSNNFLCLHLFIKSSLKFSNLVSHLLLVVNYYQEGGKTVMSTLCIDHWLTHNSLYTDRCLLQ